MQEPDIATIIGEAEFHSRYGVLEVESSGGRQTKLSDFASQFADIAAEVDKLHGDFTNDRQHRFKQIQDCHCEAVVGRYDERLW